MERKKEIKKMVLLFLEKRHKGRRFTYSAGIFTTLFYAYSILFE
ncbi:MAG: hypothetical protein N2V78_12775 [Methanophagales archaeon]|nr:hypothetical protein [Methanophagales archaeon]